jgi:hypothetical protein
VFGSGALTQLEQIRALSPSIVYWRAQNAGTVNRDGTGSTATGTDLVGRIIDLSGNNNHASAPADSNRATLNSTGWSFGGVDDYYTLASAISITTNMTVVRAFKRTTGINSGLLGGSLTREALWFGNNIIYLSLGDSSQTAGSADARTGSLVATSRRNASVQTVRINGASYSSASALAVTSSFTSFGGHAGSNFNNGEISFLAAFPSELTGADLTLVEQIAAATNGATLA